MEEEPDDTAALEAEFVSEGWTIGSKWQETSAGSGGRTLMAWRDGVTVSAQTVNGLRRKIREAQR